MKNEILAHFGIFYLLRDLFTGKKKLRDCFSAGPIDITFLALVITLLSIGIVMMFSASYVNAMYDKSASYDPYYYLKNQIMFAFIGIALMVFHKVGCFQGFGRSDYGYIGAAFDLCFDKSL